MTRSSRLVHSLRGSVLAATAVSLAAALAGCSTIDSLVSGDKLDYRTSSTPGKLTGLEVPPDLTQLTKDSRYQQTQGGSVSAAAFQAATPASAPTTIQSVSVAPDTVGTTKIERLGNDRWLRTSLPPEQLWPQLQAFWKERGFVLVQDVPAAGVMETDWAENRGKLPQDFIRSTIGRVFDSAFSTGELDKFRTRVERTEGGTDVYITHRGMVEVYTSTSKDQTTWQPRAADPQLEGEFLSRLMLRLGVSEESAKTAVAATSPGASAAPARARVISGRPSATLEIDDGFDRAWRRVGVALDRSGFTVEDRDRTQGIYFVRYVDPAFAGKDEPNLFSKLFNWGKKEDGGPVKYRVLVKSAGDLSTVSVLNSSGGAENGEAGKRIVNLLLDDLK